MKKTTFIYPYLTSYILPVLRGMADSGLVQLDVIYSPPPQGAGYGNHVPFEHPNVSWVQVDEKHPFGNYFGMLQTGILGYLIKTRPDTILLWANPRYLSFWGVLVLGRILGIRIYARGHGLYKKKKISFLQKAIYKTILALSYRYVCYTLGVRDSLLSFVSEENKLIVDYNTLYNDYPVVPSQKNGNEKGVLYIGRVRPGCGIETLIQSIARLNLQEDFKIELHIIGDGPLKDFLVEQAEKFSWIRYYGKIFEQKEIATISHACRMGCIPGIAGLNIVHMLSLSLPILTYSEALWDKGPEHDYIQNQTNGWLDKKPKDVILLAETLCQLWKKTPQEIQSMQEGAFHTYEQLSTPPYHERLLKIMEEMK